MAKKKAKQKKVKQKRITQSTISLREEYNPHVHILRMKEGVALFLLSIALLAWMFYSWKAPLVFLALSGLAISLEHFFKVHKHESHHAFKIGWILFMPAAVAFAAYRDLWSIVMLALITISFIVSVALHRRHQDTHHISAIMWRSTLGHVVAFATAILFAMTWSHLLLGEAFVSTLWVIAVITTPAAFIYYFLNKFIYLYFFERTTFAESLKKSLPRTLAHALALLLVMGIIYTGMGVALYEVKTNYFNENAEQMTAKIVAMRDVISNEPEQIAEITVNEEVNDQIAEEILNLKQIEPKEYGRLDVVKLVLTDQYYGMLINEVTIFAQAATNAVTLSTAKREVVDGVRAVLANKQFGTEFEDGSTHIEAYLVALQSEVEPRLASIERIEKYAQAIEALSRDDMLYNDLVAITGDSLNAEVRAFIEYQSPLPLELHKPYTPAEETFVYIIGHTRTAKEVYKLTYVLINMMQSEKDMPAPIWKLIENRYIEESPESKAIRYRVILSYLESME